MPSYQTQNPRRIMHCMYLKYVCIPHTRIKAEAGKVSYPHSKLITLLYNYILDIPVSVCVLFHMQTLHMQQHEVSYPSNCCTIVLHNTAKYCDHFYSAP